MFHVFNKVYLKHEALYDTNSESMYANSEKKKHPISKFLGDYIGDVPSFEEFLSNNYASTTEKLWEDLLRKDANKTFCFYTDSKILNKLLMEYWKSIFKNHTVDSLFRLYNFFILDNRLKSFQIKDSGFISRQEFYKEINFLSKQEFAELYEKTQPVEALIQQDKSKFSFEYLLADYFYNPATKYKKGFNQKLYLLAWKAWFNDIEILRGEILNSFYDVKKLVPQAQVNFESTAEVETYIRQEPMLNWMLDESFHEDNIDYVRRNYDKNIFIELHKNMHACWGTEVDLLNKDRKFQVLANDQIMPTEYVFDERYEDYLRINIEKGYGCIFTNDHLRRKSNQLFPSFVYEKVRKGLEKELQVYELT